MRKSLSLRGLNPRRIHLVDAFNALFLENVGVAMQVIRHHSTKSLSFEPCNTPVTLIGSNGWALTACGDRYSRTPHPRRHGAYTIIYLALAANYN